MLLRKLLRCQDNILLYTENEETIIKNIQNVDIGCVMYFLDAFAIHAAFPLSSAYLKIQLYILFWNPQTNWSVKGQYLTIFVCSSLQRVYRATKAVQVVVGRREYHGSWCVDTSCIAYGDEVII